ncbi:MAG: hypothetical protein H6R05_736 [Burkholderiaceae bacterium]|nr:hypothetical protein [Burkholderiaceae bacterium]
MQSNLERRMKIDIFCTVIDNWGDAGVCWRLSRQLCREWQAQVRLWIDAPEVLQPWLNELTDDEVLTVCAWNDTVNWQNIIPAEWVIETFACQIPEPYIERMKSLAVKPKWFNLEYLSAEPWVESHHLLASPQSGGLNKVFYFPGLTEKTGGLLRERDLLTRRDAFVTEHPEYWQTRTGFQPAPHALKISVFGYEHLPLMQWLPALAQREPTVQLAVAAGKAQIAFAHAWAQLGYQPPEDGHYAQGNLSAVFLPMLSQTEYDQLLWSADINAVRGEDSLVRAIWAGKPFFWNIYKQDDGAHWDKLRAFCTEYTRQADAFSAHLWSQWQMAWNTHESPTSEHFANLWQAFSKHLDTFNILSANFCTQTAQQTDLCTGLVAYGV